MSIVISCSCCIHRNNSSEFELNFQTLSLYMAFSVIAILYVANHAESCRNVACLYLWCSSQLSQIFSYYLLLSLISSIIPLWVSLYSLLSQMDYQFLWYIPQSPSGQLCLFFVACLFCVCVCLFDWTLCKLTKFWLDLVELIVVWIRSELFC